MARQLEAKARSWPLFSEHEQEIVQTLRANPKISLERAYQKAILPKLKADRMKMRQELLAELKAKPTATSAPVAATPAPAAGPTDLTEVINQAMKNSR
jgi:hypothetical protein